LRNNLLFIQRVEIWMAAVDLIVNDWIGENFENLIDWWFHVSVACKSVRSWMDVEDSSRLGAWLGSSTFPKKSRHHTVARKVALTMTKNTAIMLMEISTVHSLISCFWSVGVKSITIQCDFAALTTSRK
jgi:hypothetical protein